MTLRGQIKNGVVVLDDPAGLPEGTPVIVRPSRAKARKKPGHKPKASGRHRLLKHAGKAKGLPPDAARNLDHYLYGHPKQ